MYVRSVSIVATKRVRAKTTSLLKELEAMLETKMSQAAAKIGRGKPRAGTMMTMMRLTMMNGRDNVEEAIVVHPYLRHPAVTRGLLRWRSNRHRHHHHRLDHRE